MGLIDKVGTYLGYALAHGVDKSSGGFPQLVIDCEATHIYDPEVEDYVEVEPQLLRAWLVLYGKDQKPLFNCDSAKKVFGWDGLSFQALAEMNISETRFMFRVSENTYKDDGSMQVDGIDVDTASPTRQISSLDTKGLQNLDAKFGLAKVGKKTTSKKAPKGKPTVPKSSVKPPEGQKPKTKEEKKTSAPPPIPKWEASEETGEKTGSTTREDAWNYITDTIPGDISAADHAIAWTKAIEKIHGGPDDDTLTGEEWFKVQQLVIKESIPF